ncbi:MAG: sensor histidine kinase [Arcobacter sp.]|uniref:sensor histidine kinase n=1 Tax=Arcobacter sp. TaxID=1872629 RepID=UPI003AFF6F24
MLLSQLSISYKCHSSIGNSLKLKDMIDEVIKTFIMETDAIYGSFYLTKENIEPIVYHGKKLDFDINDLFKKSKNDEIIVISLEDTVNALLYKLENGLIVFFYDKEIDLGFITSIYESFRQKLNISINSCLNVQKLEEKNLELEDLTLNLKAKVKTAVELTKEKEKQFFEQLKMAQMGELIGNIAHQWRQPLSVISTAASGMKIKKELKVLDDEDFFHYAESILNNVTFLSDTIDEFRDYIKESHREKEIIVQDRVKMAFKMVETSFSIENIKIIEDTMEKEPIKFQLILGELLQVIIAILNNAREALSSKKSSEKWLKYSVYRDENNVIITIEDNAGGIKEEIIDKVFNPYFTTKHQSNGTGIGLYSSYDIVINHLGGTLDVENSEHGAKFFIKLPLNINYTI